MTGAPHPALCSGGPIRAAVLAGAGCWHYGHEQFCLLRISYCPPHFAVGMNSEKRDLTSRGYRGGLVNWAWKQWKKKEGRREFPLWERDLHSKTRDIWLSCGFVNRDTSSMAWASHQLKNAVCVPGSGCPSDSSLHSPAATSALVLFSMLRRLASQRYARLHVTRSAAVPTDQFKIWPSLVV